MPDETATKGLPMSGDSHGVVVTDIRMRFWSMVWFMVKWAIASIPAIIILAAIAALTFAFGSAMVLSIGRASRAYTTSVPAAPRGGSTTPSSVASSLGLPSPGPTATPASTLSPEQEAYLSQVLVRNVSVGRSVLGEPGVFGEVKNAGDRTLKEIEIRVFCLGKDGKPVFEKKFYPVLVSNLSFGASKEPLKPGYSRKFGYKLDDAPSDWTRKVEVHVSGIQFQ